MSDEIKDISVTIPDEVVPTQDRQLMRRMRSDRMTVTEAQHYRETHPPDSLKLRDALPPPPGYRYTMDGRLIPIEGSELSIRDPKAQELYCDVLTITGSERAACDALGIRSVARVRGYLMRDVDFAENVAAAKQRHVDFLYAHAHQRATVGIQSPVFDRSGTLVAYETKFSDSLMALLLKRNDPTFRDSSKTPSVTVNTGDVNVGIIDPRKMTREQRDAMRKVLKDPSEFPEQPVIDIHEPDTRALDGDK